MVVTMNESIEVNVTNGPSDAVSPNDSSDTKRFVLFSEESIKYIGDQNGFDNINDEAIRLLSSDVSYRLRHLIHNSIELMRQSKRRRLTTKDINNALESSDCEKVFGYEASDEPITESHIGEAKVHVIDDPVLDLNEEVNRIFDVSDNETNLSLFDSDVAINHIVIGEKRYSDEEDFANECSEEQKAYYEAIVRAIVGSDNVMFSMAITDLSTNRRLLKIVPHLINLIKTGIRHFNDNIPLLKRFLQTIPCLLRNPSLHLSSEPIQTVLVQSILDCVIQPLNPKADHWNLRDLASHLLANVLNHWFTPLEGHRNLENTFNCLRNSLLDFSLPFSSHYGVVKAFQSFGYDAIISHLYPILNQYFIHLMSAIETSSPDTQQRSDAIKVFGELLLISESLALKTRSLIINDMETQLNHKDYELLSDVFGDSLYARLPVSFDRFRNQFYAEKSRNCCGRQPQSLFETAESKKTGEELLDQFYEPPPHIEDMVSEMSAPLEDDNSFEDYSVISDNDRETNPMDVLRIKSTINDPRLGIKLTIKKLKRDEEPEDGLTDSRVEADIKSSPMFETNCFQTNPIVFEYGLSVECLNDDLRCAYPGKSRGTAVGPTPGQWERPVLEPSKWFLATMSRRSGPELSKRRKIHRNVKHLSLYSCDLFNVL